MINEQCNYVEGRSIDEVWREVMLLCIKNGWDFVVKGGSYEGQIRKQLPHVTLKIKEPWTRPLSPIMPPGLPGPTNEEKIAEYFERYIMSDRVAENEVYTYGSFIVKQYDRIKDLLIKSKGNTNQACIAIGDVETTFLDDPPCLRLLSFKVIEGKLVVSVFFRSWDLYAGLPENLGGIQTMKEMLVSELQEHFDVEDGELIAYSDGLHIYEQYFDIADTLNIDKIKVSREVYEDKKEYEKTM